MLAFQAFHLAAYHFAHGTSQPPPAASSPLGCSDLDRVPLRARHIPTTTSGQLPPGLLRPRRRLLSGGPGPADLNAALDVCFDPLFSCSHMQVQPAMCGRGCGGKDGDV